jgi:hypothetical protein
MKSSVLATGALGLALATQLAGPVRANDDEFVVTVVAPSNDFDRAASQPGHRLVAKREDLSDVPRHWRARQRPDRRRATTCSDQPRRIHPLSVRLRRTRGLSDGALRGARHRNGRLGGPPQRQTDPGGNRLRPQPPAIAQPTLAAASAPGHRSRPRRPGSPQLCHRERAESSGPSGRRRPACRVQPTRCPCGVRTPS